MDRTHSSPLDPLETIGVKAIHWLLPLSTLAMFLSWVVLGRSNQLTPFDKVTSWPVIVAMMGLEVAFIRRWASPRIILYATWVVWATYIVSAIGYETYLGNYQPGLSPTVLWFTLVTMMTLILFPKQHVLRIAVVYNCIGFVVLGIGLVLNPNVSQQTYNWVIQFIIGNIVFVLLLNIYLQMRDRFDEANFMAHSDALTGLANRRQMQKLLEIEVAKAERYNQTFSLLLLDLDFFKNVNDAHGHAIGDQVLKEVSRLFSNLLRETDSIARWGGEEFLILTPSTTAVQAGQLAERLRVSLSQNKIAGGLQITTSIGIAEHNRGQPLESLIEHADTALYRAKDKGRNRTEIHGL